jgi:hypothetical protein
MARGDARYREAMGWPIGKWGPARIVAKHQSVSDPIAFGGPDVEQAGRARRTRTLSLAPLIRAHAERSGSRLNAAEAAPIPVEAACAGGSAGWNLAIGAGNDAFLALLEDEAAIVELVKVPRALGAGSINPTSLRLTPAAGGYRVSGTLRHASGIQQSTSEAWST